MQSVVKLGSLFDGSGGFPLAGALNGVTPAWASEVEPYPIRVTKERFPGMKHLGSVTEVNGAEIEPVEIITFGSPCQDLSVAGKQKGIHEGARSSLFFQAVRIIKEMRENDRANGRTGKYIRPRFSVFENVPGAYSSNGGRDFQAVLEALCQIADPAISIPFPAKGKWLNAGCIVGDGFSLAWRTYDAQYWAGTPQRRKRIYLIADFGSERAGEILFERESMPGDSQPSGAPGQETARDTERSADRSDYAFVSAAFMGGQGAKAHGIAYCDDGTTPTLKATNSGSNQVPDVVYQNTGIGWWNESKTAETLRTPCGGDSTKANLVVYSIEGKCIDRNSKQNGKGWCEGKSASLNTVDRHAVCHSIDCRNLADNGDVSGTLQAKPNGGYSLNYQNPVVHNNCLNPWDNQSARQYTINGVYETLRAHQGGRNEGIVYPAITGALCANSHPGSYTGQDAYNDMLPVIESDKPPRKWIVRRLTPLECNRLQGFPDGWGNVSEIADLTDEEHAFWKAVRNTHAAINGKKQADYTKAQMIKWLNVLHTDSAEYKMWGNGIALPCARDVIRRIAEAISQERGISST